MVWIIPKHENISQTWNLNGSNLRLQIRSQKYNIGTSVDELRKRNILTKNDNNIVKIKVVYGANAKSIPLIILHSIEIFYC